MARSTPAARWEAVIPEMRYEDLLRHLAEFEDAGVADSVLAQVAFRLAHPDNIIDSGILPFEFWCLYRQLQNSYFRPALERAVETSVESVLPLSGRTLFAIDVSEFMGAQIDGHPDVTRIQVAALFASALQSGSSVDVIMYAEKGRLVTDLPQSVLRAVRHVESRVGDLGNYSRTWPSVTAHYRGQDRIVVVTAMADHPGRVTGLPDVPIYVWDLSGFEVDLSEPERYLFRGFSDTAFYMIPLLEGDVTSDPSQMNWFVSRTERG
jgi:hypothetical protein